jgi:hypothetical protein
MTLTLDHVVIAVRHLQQGIADYRDLGFTVIYGGKHASGTTHNALVCFKDGTYLELLALTGEKPSSGAMDFSHLLQYDEGVVAYALASDDLETDALALREQGIDVGDVNEGGRKREDGVELRWKTALIDGSMSPFLIQDITPRDLRVPDDEATTTHRNGAQGIAALVITVNLLSEQCIDHCAHLLGTEPERSPGRVTFAIGNQNLILSSANADLPLGYALELSTTRNLPFDRMKTHNLVIVEQQFSQTANR